MVLLVCFILEEANIHQRFYKWPLHLTLVPWFQVSGVNLMPFIQELECLASATKPLVLTAGNLSSLGKNRKVRVAEVAQNDRLMELHETLLDIIRQVGSLERRAHIGKYFRPHITLKEDEEIKKGRKYRVEDLFIVSREEKGAREIVEVIKLGKPKPGGT